MKDICSVKNCKKPISRRSYCNAHYIKFRRYGDPSYQKHLDKCKISDCDRKYYSTGYCRIHYNRIWSTGSSDKKDQRKYIVNDYFFSTDTEESFYWAGFLAADGCVQKGINSDTYYISLTLSLKDKEHV